MKKLERIKQKNVDQNTTCNPRGNQQQQPKHCSKDQEPPDHAYRPATAQAATCRYWSFAVSINQDSGIISSVNQFKISSAKQTSSDELSKA